jgi:hypothetical protein
MPADEYVNANDMIERAIEYEKVADEIDALGEVSDTDNPSLEEFIKTWDAVAVKE